MDMENLRLSCLSCKNCPLHETRTNVVFGVGNPSSSVMLIGEGPGANEDLQGEPFVGRAGLLLDDMLKIIDLDRHKNVYITNIVKCRPPKNRDPLNTEQDACMGWLRQQYLIIKPKIVVCLGRIAAMALIMPSFKITAEHGQVFDKDGVKFFAIYHPAALLRDQSKMPDTFVDLKNLQTLIREVAPETYENM